MTTQPLSALAELVASRKPDSVGLHLGCGGVRWKDFINVDFYPHDASVSDTSRSGCVADAFADIRRLGLPDESVDEIFTAHTFEHFPRWEAIDMLRDWYRMLRKGGTLIIETPDFWRCVLWLFHPSRTKRGLGRSQFYGNQWDKLDFETHRYVWSEREISEAASSAGFSFVRTTHRTETHYPGRDLRLEARK